MDRTSSSEWDPTAAELSALRPDCTNGKSWREAVEMRLPRKPLASYFAPQKPSGG